MNSKLLIVGSGGHGNVIADVAEKLNKFKEISFLDDKFLISNSPKIINSKRLIGEISLENIRKFSSDFSHAFIGIGDNMLRIKWLQVITKMGFIVPTIIDPSAEVSKYAFLEKGSFINTKVVIQANVIIKSGCILNTASTVDHDSKIGEGVHISPGVNIGGNVNIGKSSWIGIGTNIINNINIGENVIVGAGSLVLKNIPKNVQAFGSPTNIIKKFNEN